MNRMSKENNTVKSSAQNHRAFGSVRYNYVCESNDNDNDNEFLFRRMNRKKK